MQRVAQFDASPLLRRPGVARLMAVLRAGGADVRFVGGAVRDMLLERPVGDIDLAIDIAPDQTRGLLRRAGIATLDYGMAHGTVAAVSQGGVFEITSLRVDVKALGRHAEVAFTDDWQADAERRDFTINTLYLDADGGLYDPCGGRADLAAHRVRFVGDAAARIAEDRLRILRYFRFLTWYGRGDGDAAALAACAAAAAEIAQLSGERIRGEMLKLLAAPCPEPVLQLMQAAGVLSEVVPGEADLTRLRRTLAGERGAGVAGDPLRRLAALLAGPDEVAWTAERWRLSRQEAERLRGAVAPTAGAAAAVADGDARLLLYRAGREQATDLALLAGDGALAVRLAAAAPPVFPIKGRDLRQQGMPPGRAMGAMLAALEAWWVEGGFAADRAALLRELDRRRAAET